jgi:hypothetical protein
MQDKAGLARCLSVDDPSMAKRPCCRVSVLASTLQPAGQYTSLGRGSGTVSPCAPLKKCGPGGNAPLRHAAEQAASS